MAYSKIRQPKLSDVIEQQLEFLILEGTLRPGEKLPPERELAKQFDVSRPSLREAIQRLEAKGLLLRRQGGGTFVQSSLWQSFSDPLSSKISSIKARWRCDASRASSGLPAIIASNMRVR